MKFQASDREMHDILNWMHDYESEGELNDEDDEDEEEGDEKEGHQAGSQKEVEEMYIHPGGTRGGVRSARAHIIFLSGCLVWRRRRRSPRPSRACSRSPPPSSKRHARTLRYAFPQLGNCLAMCAH